MKRFSKILSVVLALCLLCGALAISVFAADSANNSDANLKLTTLSGPTGINLVSVNTMSSSLPSRHSGMENFANIKRGGTAETNEYAVIYREGTTATDNSGYVSLYGDVDSGKAPATDPADLNFVGWRVDDPRYPVDGTTDVVGPQMTAVTVDFDFGSDKWAYTEDGTSKTILVAPEDLAATELSAAEEATLRPALDGCGLATSGAMFRFVIRGRAHDGKSATTLVPNVYFYREGNNIYLTDKGSGVAPTNKVPLSNTPGVFDHFTFIIHPDSGKTNGYVDIEILVNGQHVGKVESNNWTYQYFDAFRFFVGANVDNFSYAIDNTAINWYKPDDPKSADIADFLAKLGTDDEKPIYEYANVVYNDDYVQAGCGSVSVENPDETATSTYNAAMFDSVIATLKSDGKIILDGANINANFDTQVITGFSVELKNGATFNAPGYQTADGVNYTVATQISNLDWVDFDGNKIGSTQIAIGQYPAPGATFAADAAELDAANGTVTTVTGWEWDPVTKGTFIPIDEKALDTAMWGNLVRRERNDDPIQIKPIASEPIEIAYSIVDAEGKIPVDPTTLTSMSTFAANFANANDGWKFTLYDAAGTGVVDLSGKKITLAKANVNVTLDLNDLTVLRTGTGIAYWTNLGDCLFVINAENVNLTLINGKFIQSVPASTRNDSGLVRVTGVDAASVTFGVKGDDTKAVDYIGGSLVRTDNYSNSAKHSDGAGEIHFNVYGGKHYYQGLIGYGVYSVDVKDVKINVEDAELVYAASVSDTSYGLFGVYSPSNSPNYELVCNNSTIICTNEAATAPKLLFTNNKMLGGTAEFNNCFIYAELASKASDGITLGAGTVVNKEFSNAFVYDDCKFATNVAPAYAVDLTETFTVNYPKNYTYDHEGNAANATDSMFSDVQVNLSVKVGFVTYDTSAALPEGLVNVSYSLDGQASIFDKVAIVGDNLLNSDLGNLVTVTPVNTWLGTKPTAWKADSSSIVTEAGGTFVPTDINYVAAPQAQINMQLWAYAGMNFYAPDVIDGITITGIFSGATELTAEKPNKAHTYLYTKVYDFGEYNLTLKFTATYDFDNSGTVEEDEQNVAFEATYTFDPLSYATAVVDAYGCSEEAELLYDIIRFKADLAKAAGALNDTVEAKVTAFYAKFDNTEVHPEATCQCVKALADVTITETDTDSVALSEKYLLGDGSGYGFSFGTVPYFNVYVDTATYDATTQYAEVTVNTVDIYGDAKALSAKTPDTADEAYIRCDFEADCAWEINQVYTITVTIKNTADDSVVDSATGTYSLADFYAEMMAKSTPDTVNADLAKALWIYSDSAYNYKIVEAQ